MLYSLSRLSARRPSFLVRIIAFSGAALTPFAASRADGPAQPPSPEPPSVEIRLANGRVVSYAVPFNRNSLKSSARADDGLIALTSSGALLRFALPDFRLTRERVHAEAFTCLGRGENGAVLAGLSDGRICRVDPKTLEPRELARVDAPPRWIGWRPGAKDKGHPQGLIAVVRKTRSVEEDGDHWDQPYSVVHDLTTGKSFALEEEMAAFLLDRAGRLWLGADKGEWGGRLWRVDLDKGTMTQLKPPPSPDPKIPSFWEGVYGFIELRDGQVWAYGGTSHMGFNSAGIVRVDGARPQPLLTEERVGHERKAVRPELPITHIVKENDGGLLVFSYNDVFRTDAELKSWKRAATLDLQYRWGRPDAVGSYPAVQTVHPSRRAGDPCVLATIADGYVALDGAKPVSHALSGQLGAEDVRGLAHTAEGTLIFDPGDELPAWKFGAKGWETVDFAPPFEVDPDSPDPSFEKDSEIKEWSATHVLVGPGGAISTVSGSGMVPGTRTTARWSDGKIATIGRETSSLKPSTTFVTADGVLWSADWNELKRFENGRWSVVAALREDDRAFQLSPINTDGPPWFLVERVPSALWELNHGPRGARPDLKTIAWNIDGKSPRVITGVPWKNGELLLATDHGLQTFHPHDRKFSRFPIKGGPKCAYVKALTRDGLGRLWLGSREGLWMIEAEGEAAEPFDRVPGVGHNEVEALAADPRHKDGVIVALGEKGVAFLRAPERKPSRGTERQ